MSFHRHLETQTLCTTVPLETWRRRRIPLLNLSPHDEVWARDMSSQSLQGQGRLLQIAASIFLVFDGAVTQHCCPRVPVSRIMFPPAASTQMEEEGVRCVQTASIFSSCCELAFAEVWRSGAWWGVKVWVSTVIGTSSAVWVLV